MTEEESAPAPRRRGRPAGSAQRTTPPRRRRVGGAELVETLNEMVSQLIKENRQLKRQLAKVMGRSPESDNGATEKTLRSLHRKVMRAVAAVPVPRRRRTAATSATPRRRS